MFKRTHFITFRLTQYYTILYYTNGNGSKLHKDKFSREENIAQQQLWTEDHFFIKVIKNRIKI